MEWISVHKQMPSWSYDLSDRVLAFSDHADWSGDYCIVCHPNDLYPEGEIYEYVTHWMPLPEPPKNNT